jgi:hypothetical protein
LGRAGDAAETSLADGFVGTGGVVEGLPGISNTRALLTYVEGSSFPKNSLTHWLTALERKSSLSVTLGRPSGTRTKIAPLTDFALYLVHK